MPRILNTRMVVDPVAKLVQDACCLLDDNLTDSIKAALATEESPIAKDILKSLIENAAYAREQYMPACHDTGTCVLFVEVGQQIAWEGEPLEDMLNQGVEKGYGEGYLRKSMVEDPLHGRKNTGTNTPAVIHTYIVPGDQIKITAFPKGGGSENMGSFTTLVPAAGEAGVKEYVLDCMRRAGGKPCPPVIIGVGVGGTMDKCCELAKLSLLRPVGSRNKNPMYAKLEEDILKAVNDTGIGPMGLGGRSTALDVHIEYFPCHITALPVAVNSQCHVSRHATVVL